MADREHGRARMADTPGANPLSGGRWSRVIVAAVALAVAAAGIVVAWPILTSSDTPRPDGSTREAAMHALADVPEGFTELPAPPEVRTGAVTAWTGSEVLVWGGYVYDGTSDKSPLDTGFAFDAERGMWSEITPSPLSPRSFPASAWTGSELLIWGGWDGTWSSEPGTIGDGAAYDPASRTWRMLPPAPIGARAPLSAWTGRELLVWGTSLRVTHRPRDGAAYDPFRDSWRPMADAPIELTDATAVWTGREMIVFGAALHGGNFPESETAIGAAYDPATDTWRRIPDSELSPQASTAAWDGTEMIAWDYLNGTAAYDPATDGWRELPRVPSRDYECSPESVGVRGYVVGVYCGQLVVYSAAEGLWHNVPQLGGWLLQPIAAEPVVVLLAQNYRTEEQGTFAYRPPTTFGCAGVTRADPTDPEAARGVAEAFLAFRVDNAKRDLNGILTASGQGAYDEGGGLPPLFDDYIDWEIVFVDGPLEPASGVSPSAAEGASHEVGVRLLDGRERRVVETIFVSGPERMLSGDSCALAVIGARPGLTGP